MELDRGDDRPDRAIIVEIPVVTQAELSDSPPLHILYAAALSTYPHFTPTFLRLLRVSD